MNTPQSLLAIFGVGGVVLLIGAGLYAAAATGGVAVGDFYLSSGAVRMRVV